MLKPGLAAYICARASESAKSTSISEIVAFVPGVLKLRLLKGPMAKLEKEAVLKRINEKKPTIKFLICILHCEKITPYQGIFMTTMATSKHRIMIGN
jgi:hypothetical protein